MGHIFTLRKRFKMKKKNYKGRCEKRILSKCKGVCKTHDSLQYKYSDLLEQNDEVKEFQCNVLLENAEYTSDFVCKKLDGDIMVRECVLRKHLSKPMTIKLLDISRDYWLRHGVYDWGLVIDEE